MSHYEFSPFMDIKVSNPKAAAEFYIRHFGWIRAKSDSHEQTLNFGPLTIFLTQAENKSSKSNVHFEMATSDKIENVKAALEKDGCTSCPSGMKNAFMFTDPYGNNFHIWQK